MPFARLGLAIAVVALVLASAASASAATSLALPGCRDTLLHRNDDESSASVGLPFAIDFFGNEYNALYVNNNGNVTFDAPLGDYVPFNLTQTSRVIIAPFFADVDTRPSDGGTVTYGETTYDGRPAFCVLWDDVGYYSNQTDRRNSFQLLLVRGTPATGDFDIVFRYDKVQWELGSASGGVSARAGFSNGETARSVELTGSAVNGSFLDGGSRSLSAGSLDSSDRGTWVFHVRSGTAGNDPRNVPQGIDRGVPWWNWPDGDGDGLPDHWERVGVWVGSKHVDLPGLGANPNVKDAFVYVDVVAGERWNSTIESMLRSSFHAAPLGIALHIVRGSRVLNRSEVPAQVSARDSFFAPMARLGFSASGLGGLPGSVPALAKYACACPDHAGGGGIGGQANGIKADHLVLTVYEARWLADIKRETGISFSNEDLVGDRLNAISLMHELGHLYGLKHHGTSHTPAGDPAYRSIMSYAYNAFGVPRSAQEAIDTGDLLPRIDFSRESSVNYDWQMGGGFGRLSLVYGQHGERGSFYTSVEEIPDGAEEAPAEAGIDELLADPAIREQIAAVGREVAAALNPPASAQPLGRGKSRLGRVTLTRKRVIAMIGCNGAGPCAGRVSIALAGEGRRRKDASAQAGRGSVVGSARYALEAGASRRVAIKLSPRGIKRVREAGSRRIALTVRVSGLKKRVVRVAAKGANRRR